MVAGSVPVAKKRSSALRHGVVRGSSRVAMDPEIAVTAACRGMQEHAEHAWARTSWIPYTVKTWKAVRRDCGIEFWMAILGFKVWFTRCNIGASPVLLIALCQPRGEMSGSVVLPPTAYHKYSCWPTTQLYPRMVYSQLDILVVGVFSYASAGPVIPTRLWIANVNHHQNWLYQPISKTTID